MILTSFLLDFLFLFFCLCLYFVHLYLLFSFVWHISIMKLSSNVSLLLNVTENDGNYLIEI